MNWQIASISARGISYAVFSAILLMWLAGVDGITLETIGWSALALFVVGVIFGGDDED